MTTTIQKWGNSLAVRLPKLITRRLRVRAGTEVRVEMNRQRIIIEQVPKKEETLRGLVAKIIPGTRHKKIDWGRTMGKEAW